jgi:hypothetical protein
MLSTTRAALIILLLLHDDDDDDDAELHIHSILFTSRSSLPPTGGCFSILWPEDAEI